MLRLGRTKRQPTIDPDLATLARNTWAAPISVHPITYSTMTVVEMSTSPGSMGVESE